MEEIIKESKKAKEKRKKKEKILISKINSNRISLKNYRSLLNCPTFSAKGY